MNAASPEFGHIIALVSAAAGGFFGSGSAFLLEWLRRKKEDRTQKYEDLFKTQYILITQHNSLLVLKQHYLDIHRNDPDRFLKLVPIVNNPSPLRVDIAKLAFLANESAATTLNDIYIAESCYGNALAALEMRNQKLQELMNDPTVQVEDFDFETGRGRIAANPRKVRVIKGLTDGLYDSLDDAEAKYAKLIPAMSVTIKKLFPKKKAFHYVAAKNVSDRQASG